MFRQTIANHQSTTLALRADSWCSLFISPDFSNCAHRNLNDVSSPPDPSAQLRGYKRYGLVQRPNQFQQNGHDHITRSLATSSAMLYYYEFAAIVALTTPRAPFVSADSGWPMHEDTFLQMVTFRIEALSVHRCIAASKLSPADFKQPIHSCILRKYQLLNATIQHMYARHHAMNRPKAKNYAKSYNASPRDMPF